MGFNGHVADSTGVKRSLQRRMVVPLLALSAFVAAVDLTVIVGRLLEPEPAIAAPTATLPPTTTTTAPQPHVPVSTALATPQGAIQTFDAPDGNVIGTAGHWYGYPMTMPIVEERGAWLRIRLPERPNGSTAWVRATDVVASTTTYRIVIRLGQTNLTVYESGFPLFTAPAGVGTERTPTAIGNFFVAVIEKPGPRGYGPIVLDLSGHSEAIESFEGSGDAIIAIHGPISASSDEQIGTAGTYISNGCIRLHEEDQLRLDVIPLGTPVDIVA